MTLSTRIRTVLLGAIVLGTLAAAAPPAAQPSPAVGTKVVIKSGAALKIGDRVVPAGHGHRVYDVARLNGGWLWLTSGPVAGWAKADDVLSLDAAIALYTREIERSPHAPWPHYNRGLIHQDRGDADKALADYSEAVRQDSAFVPALINRGNLWLLKRDYDRAITDYSEAIRLDPSYALAWMNRSGAREAKGEYAEALADLAEAIRLAPESPRGYARRAWILATCPVDRIRDGRDAVALASKASALAGPRDASVLDVSAAAHAEAGEFAKAVYWETKAIALLPTTSPDAGAYRARLQLYQGQKPFRERRSDSPSS